MTIEGFLLFVVLVFMVWVVWRVFLFCLGVLWVLLVVLLTLGATYWEGCQWKRQFRLIFGPPPKKEWRPFWKRRLTTEEIVKKAVEDSIKSRVSERPPPA